MKDVKNWKGLLYGIAYGLVSRAIFALEDFRGEEYGKALFPTYGLMTMSFMFIVPLVIGLITAYHQDNITSPRKIAMILCQFLRFWDLLAFQFYQGKRE